MDLQVKSQKNKMELQASAMSHRQKMEQLRQESLFDMVNRMSKPNPKQVQ